MDRNRAIPRREEDEKRRTWRKWRRPEPWRHWGGWGLRLGELETGASPDWSSRSRGRGRWARAGRPGRGAGSCVVRNGAASRRPRLPGPSPPGQLGLQLPRRRFSSHRAPSAGKVETPRAPRPPRPPLSTPGAGGGGGHGKGRRRAGVGLPGREGGSPTAGAGNLKGLRQDAGGSGRAGPELRRQRLPLPSPPLPPVTRRDGEARLLGARVKQSPFWNLHRAARVQKVLLWPPGPQLPTPTLSTPVTRKFLKLPGSESHFSPLNGRNELY